MEEEESQEKEAEVERRGEDFPGAATVPGRGETKKV